MATDRPAVTMYTLSGCAHCARARRLLARRSIDFREVRGDGDPGFRRMLRELTGRGSVPQITIGGVPVGGASELARLDRRRVLVPLTRGASFPMAVVGRRFNAVGLVAAPFGGTCGLWRHVVELVDRDGRVIERLPAGLAGQAAGLAAVLNEQKAAA